MKKEYSIEKHAAELSELHHKAMNYAEEGFFLQRKGNADEAKKKYKVAFDIEKQVADSLLASTMPVDKLEPSRSTITLSAAALAKDAGDIKEMNKYASKVIELNYDSYFVEEALSLKSN